MDRASSCGSLPSTCANWGDRNAIAPVKFCYPCAPDLRPSRPFDDVSRDPFVPRQTVLARPDADCRLRRLARRDGGHGRAPGGAGDRQLRLSRRAGAGEPAQRCRGCRGRAQAAWFRNHRQPRCRPRRDAGRDRRVLRQGRGRRCGAVLLCRPRDAASGHQLSDAGRRQSHQRGRTAPHDQAQRYRVRREARQGAAHHGDRRLPRQSAHREARRPAGCGRRCEPQRRACQDLAHDGARPRR